MMRTGLALLPLTVLASGQAAANGRTSDTAFFAGIVPVAPAGDATVVDLAQKLERLVGNDLARATKRKVAPYADLLRLRTHGYQPYYPDVDFDGAAQAFGRGLLAYRGLDYAKALAEFTAARAAYEAKIEGLRDYTGYLRALTYQLLAATTTGDAKIADDAATRLYTVRPNFKPEAGLLVAAARSAADAAKSRLAAASTGRLDIATSPSNAVVFLDGERRDDCRTPCTLESLAPGPHAVIIAANDHVVERRRIDIAATASTSLKIPLKPDAGKAALRSLRERLVQPVSREALTALSAKLASAVGARSIIVGALAPKGVKAGRGLRVVFVEAAVGEVSVAYGEIDADLLEGTELAERVRAWLDASPKSDRFALPNTAGAAPTLAAFDFRASILGVHEVEPIVITPPVPDAPRIYERWWFWTAIGAAVAGGVVTILATKKTETVVGPATNTVILTVPP